jgi:hypothetical protein
MLKIYFGEMEEICYGPLWFKYSFDLEWFQDSFVQQMIQEVDHSTYVTGGVIDSPVLGPIPPEKLSGGVQTLIMIYELPDKVFDATSCGPNCAKWLFEIGKKKDVTVNLRYLMPVDELEPFEIEILNDHTVVRTTEEYMMSAFAYL